MSQRSVGEKYFQGIQGWRAVAILAVILSHSTGFLFSNGEEKSLLHRGFLFGAHGVDLFFAISGFLICTKLLEEEIQSGRARILNFYKKRFFRILPIYLFYLFFLFALAHFYVLDIPKAQIYSSFIFLQNYQISAGNWHYSLAHFWTLAVEEHFYLFFPLFLIALPKNRSIQLLGCLLVAVLISIWRFVDFRFQIFDLLLPNLAFFMRSDVRMDALLYGCLAAILYSDEKMRDRVRSILNFPYSGTLFLGIFLLTITIEIPLSLSIRGLSASVVILLTALFPGKFPLLEWRPLTWIGAMSYSLYVWNSFFLWPNYLEPVPYFRFLQLAPWNFLFLFIVAYLTYTFIEKPMIQLGKRWNFR